MNIIIAETFPIIASFLITSGFATYLYLTQGKGYTIDGLGRYHSKNGKFIKLNK